MKRLKFTDKIKEKFVKANGAAEFNPDDYAFFETTAINDLPLTKPGTIYDGARMTLGTLEQMTNHVQKENFVPLHTLHKQGSELPVGRVIHAEMNHFVNDKGTKVSEIRSLFYVPLKTNEGRALADGIDAGIINEVSVGVRPKVLKCSSCDFDYMGPKANFMNWIDRTCDNDHAIGKDGVHAVFDGMSKFYELSLVSIGAADHARIHPSQEAITASAQDESPAYQRLYATKGTEKDTVMELTAAQLAELRAELEKNGKEAIDAKFTGVVNALALVKDKMTLADATAARDLFKAEMAKFEQKKKDDAAAAAAAGNQNGQFSMNDVANLKAEIIVKDAKLTALTEQVTALQASNTTLTTENAGLKGVKIQLDAMTSEVTPVREFLKVAAQSMMVASGVEKPVIPESFTDLLGAINTAKTKLTKLPVGGLLLASETGTAKDQNSNTGQKDPGAFKSKK